MSRKLQEQMFYIFSPFPPSSLPSCPSPFLSPPPPLPLPKSLPSLSNLEDLMLERKIGICMYASFQPQDGRKGSTNSGKDLPFRALYRPALLYLEENSICQHLVSLLFLVDYYVEKCFFSGVPCKTKKGVGKSKGSLIVKEGIP